MNKDLEKRVTAIEERNKRVELDKKCETSITRKICICVLTYIVVLIYSNSIVGSYTRSVYSSDYFLGKNNMAENYTIEISSGTSGLVSVGIIAIDDYNKESSMWVCDYSLRNTNTKY